MIRASPARPTSWTSRSTVTDAHRGSILVIGLGNELRGDDGAGIAVARRLRDCSRTFGLDVREQRGEPSDLLETWQHADAVVLVDTMHSGAPPGTLRRFDASSAPLPAPLHGSSSTHALGLSEAIELGRALGRLPARVIVYAVEGHMFGAGQALSPKVETALAPLAAAVLRQARSLKRASAHA